MKKEVKRTVFFSRRSRLSKRDGRSSSLFTQPPRTPERGARPRRGKTASRARVCVRWLCGVRRVSRGWRVTLTGAGG